LADQIGESLLTPVAFFIFNRPEATKLVFSAIREARPQILFLICDGPRQENFSDVRKVELVREIVSNVDWDCKVFTNYSDENLGCKTRVSTGIDWVFSIAQEAIFLEDDCLPSQSFFRFCATLLDFYRENPRVGVISGNTYNLKKDFTTDSYLFSNVPNIWGWATWKDRWDGNYDADIAAWPKLRETQILKEKFNSREQAEFWAKQFDNVHAGLIDTWDYQLVLSSIQNDWLSIIPARNLISNIGFDVDATHTTSPSVLGFTNSHEIEFPLKHPGDLNPNFVYDSWYFKNFMKPSNGRIYARKIKIILRNSVIGKLLSKFNL
jgi:hypothetical protein